MTDREKLIEILRVPIYPHEQADPAEVVADYLLDNGVTFAKDTNVPSWIPVAERLPEKECIAIGFQNEMLIGWVGADANSDTGYFAENEGEILGNVTHWMELPEPPKGE